MPYPISISDIVRLTGASREAVLRRIAGLPWTPAPHQAKMYDSKAALRCVIVGDGETESPQDRLATKCAEQIDLQMETERKERIPIEYVEEHNETVLQTVAGIFKANENKKLTPELVQEIFAELRRMEEVLVNYCRRKNAPEPEKVEEPEEDPMFQ